jgi:hypothetical protein
MDREKRQSKHRTTVARIQVGDRCSVRDGHHRNAVTRANCSVSDGVHGGAAQGPAQQLGGVLLYLDTVGKAAGVIKGVVLFAAVAVLMDAIDKVGWP